MTNDERVQRVAEAICEAKEIWQKRFPRGGDFAQVLAEAAIAASDTTLEVPSLEWVQANIPGSANNNLAAVRFYISAVRTKAALQGDAE